MVEKKGIWIDVLVINKTNQDFDGSMKRICVGIKRRRGQQAREPDTGISTLRAHNGEVVCSSNRKGITSRVSPQAKNAHNQRKLQRRIREGKQRVGGVERRCISKEDGGSEGLRRDITREVKRCTATLEPVERQQGQTK